MTTEASAPTWGEMRRVPAILATAGLVVSIVLQVLHVRSHLFPTSSSFCAIGPGLDCDAVALSRFSVVLGVPLSSWGIVGFATLLWAALARPALLLPLSALAAAASLATIAIELLDVGSICLLCEAIHVLAFALLVVTWRSRARDRAAARPLRQTLSELAVPAAVLIAAAIAIPPYWVRVSWQSGMRLPHGVLADGHPYVGGAEPELVVHEYVDYGCPHCAVATGLTRLRVAEHGEALQIVRHHQPRMRCTPAEPGSTRCLFARIAICAGQQDAFWEMEDWLFAHARGHERVDVGEAAAAVHLDEQRLATCVDAPETFATAEVDASAARKQGIVATPGYVIDGKRLNAQEALDRIDEAL